MEPGDWSRVKAVLDQVLDVPPAQRAAILDRECAHADGLRAEVEALLHEADADPAACAIEQFVVSNARWSTAPSDDGRFGPYTAVEELGRGGMGTVYRALRSDGQFQQEVAIKVIAQAPLQRELTPQFLRERQILAGLNHPNIARLVDGGLTATGAPYLVMELVHGLPLLAHVAQQQTPVAERLRLFVRVCDAVAHAHGQLVVHRDIKPSNILVTPQGLPKLLDFGLARMLDDSLRPAGDRTIVGFRAFTPNYAAPEHLRGMPATTAGDIYSLGVLLFVLLTGRTPHTLDGLGIDRMQQALAAPPPAPSEVASASSDAAATQPALVPAAPAALLAGDLDAIVLKAIDADPERRYATVRELADDIERHLSGRPVMAHAPTPLYRAGKFVRRHQMAVAASVAVALGLTTMLGVTLWQARVARDERDRAARRFADVRRLANDLLFELAPRIERLPGATDARQQMLQRALTYLDSLASEADDSSLRRELAVAYEKVGDLQGNPTNPNLMDLDAALSSYRKAQALRQQTAENDPRDRQAQEALAENHRVLGTVLAQAGDFSQSTAELSAAADAYRALLADAPGDIGLRVRLARAIHDVGRNESNTKRYAGSIARFHEAIDLARSARDIGPTDRGADAVLADSHAQLGLALSWEGRQAEAETHVLEANRIYERALGTQPDDVAWAGGLWSAYWVASSVFEEQDDQRAHVFAIKALDLARRVVAVDAANIRGRQQLAKSLSRAGQTATNLHRTPDALAYSAEATTIWRDIVAGEAKNSRLRSELALALTRLADAKRADGALAQALTDAEEADAVYAALAAASPNDKRSLRNRVVTLELMGDIQAAMARLGHDQAGAQARQRYGEAVALLQALGDNGALAAVDGQFFEKLRRKAAALSSR